MIVLDASAAVEWLLQTPAGHRIESRIFASSESLHAPELLDLEVIQVVRRLALKRAISDDRAGEAVRDLQDLRIHRYEHKPLTERIWELRHNLTSYDAAYVVLAEILEATLITRDSKLVSASGHTAKVELF